MVSVNTGFGSMISNPSLIYSYPHSLTYFCQRTTFPWGNPSFTVPYPRKFTPLTTRIKRTMGSASRVKLSLEACGEFHVPGITKESAVKATELLQENHERHHIFFNAEGFHSMNSPTCSIS